MQSYSKNISFFCLYVSHLLKGGKVGQKIIDNMNAPKTGNIVCANISGFKAEVCYWTFFNWVTCNWLTTFWIQHRITRTNLYSLWPLFKKKVKGKPYANAVISGLVGIMITYVGNLKNKKIAAQMLLGQEAVGRLPLDESMVTNTMLF